MSKIHPFELTFSLNVLHHLGMGLYSNTPAILSEMVANSYDADATRVVINTEKSDEIIIEDNGIGMSLDDINEKYLRVGYQRRIDLPTVTLNQKRHVMGRKGIGKLSVFSIADVVEIHSCKDGKKSGCILSQEAIEAAIHGGTLKYNPTSVEPDQIDIIEGTRIALRKLKQPMSEIEPSLRTNLARRFSIVDKEHNFEVIINKSPISLKDRNYYDKIQFMWYLGDESQKFVNRCSNLKDSIKLSNVVDINNGYEVTGWIATVFKPKDIDDQHHAIALFAHGKLIQEDILADFQDARLYVQYLIGEIDADFMDLDNEDDIVTSDRQRINQNDPRYVALKLFVASHLKKIANKWDALRKQSSPKKPHQTSPSPLETNENNSPEQSTFLGPQVPFENRQPAPLAPPPPTPVGPQPTGEQQIPPTPIPFVQPTSEKPKPFVPSSPPELEAEALLNDIKSKIQISAIEQELKKTALYDLEQARIAYFCRAHKACVVMLGSVLEGIMLGVLRRPEVLRFIKNDPNLPKQVNRKLNGTQNPEYSDEKVFANAIGENLSFDDYKLLIHSYIPNIDELGIGDIQRFRNAIHPWIAIQKPNVYGDYDAARAISYLGALKILAHHILSWSP